MKKYKNHIKKKNNQKNKKKKVLKIKRKIFNQISNLT